MAIIKMIHHGEAQDTVKHYLNLKPFQNINHEEHLDGKPSFR